MRLQWKVEWEGLKLSVQKLVCVRVCQLQAALRSAVANAALSAIDGTSDSAESHLLSADVCNY